MGNHRIRCVSHRLYKSVDGPYIYIIFIYQHDCKNVCGGWRSYEINLKDLIIPKHYFIFLSSKCGASPPGWATREITKFPTHQQYKIDVYINLYSSGKFFTLGWETCGGRGSYVVWNQLEGVNHSQTLSSYLLSAVPHHLVGPPGKSRNFQHTSNIR